MMLTIKRYILLIVATLGSLPLFASTPLYIVKGKIVEDITSIPQSNIERIEMLDADEQTIAKYGEKASNGVAIITLRYDELARFSDSLSFKEYILRNTEWGEGEPTARVVLKYVIRTDGQLDIIKELESTEARLKRRVLKTISTAPNWTPAIKDGKAVETEGIVHITMPVGRRMPQEGYIRR